ncbi:hypothetical protein [uncultured Draconibacterium sp.]|uniref:hypothetical protein n=1 Tax=uncultured Draconibacterium sp. TaxID=1573823 RepID=UPI0029C92F88|nr:hypothetical protein [uncultured Draconibacterium sp.]
MKNNKKITIRILNIKVQKFNQSEITLDFNREKTPLVEFQTNFSFKYSIETEQIMCITNIKVIIIETKEMFAELDVHTEFAIKSLSDFITMVDGKEKIDNVLLFNVCSVSVSTIRGILFEKLKGSELQNEIYPLVDLSSLFPIQ